VRTDNVPADGQPHILEGSVFRDDGPLATLFAELVPSGRVLSVACPLPSLCTVDDVASRLVAPLLKHAWPV
jgi:hypothetical protein